MQLRSLDGCQLAIGSYPPFNYDASGGGGIATLLSTEKEHILHISFASKTFSIPPLSSKTTKFLSLPLPLGLKIEMSMDKLEGTVDKNTGEILLIFESRFIFSICNKFHFPDLIVKTNLETCKVKGVLHEAEGQLLQKNGKAILVGIANIPATRNKILDIFLGLPNEALAVLKCEII